MLNTLLSRKEYWIRCFSVAQQSAASLRAILYSQKWASFLYEYRWEAGACLSHHITPCHIIVCNIIFSDTETRRGIHDSRWLDFWCYEDREMRQKRKVVWMENLNIKIQTLQSVDWINLCTRLKMSKWSSQFNFSSISLACLPHFQIWSMLILNFSQEIINFTSGIEILFGQTVALSVPWHSC